jgi:hypothetical protein
MVGLTIGIDIAAGAPGPASFGPGPCNGGLAQAASNPRIAADSTRRAEARFRHRRTFDMWVILLEAFGAMALLILIVWWTMFSGRQRGERRDE